MNGHARGWTGAGWPAGLLAFALVAQAAAPGVVGSRGLDRRATGRVDLGAASTTTELRDNGVVTSTSATRFSFARI